MKETFADYPTMAKDIQKFLCEEIIKHRLPKVKEVLPATFARATQNEVKKLNSTYGKIENINTSEKGYCEITITTTFGISHISFDCILNVKEDYIPKIGDKLMTRSHHTEDAENGKVKCVEVLVYKNGIYEPVAINYFSLNKENNQESSLTLTSKILKQGITEAASYLQQEVNSPAQAELLPSSD
jgi:hypothetical protein